MNFGKVLSSLLVGSLVFAGVTMGEAAQPTDKADKHSVVVFDTDVGTDDAVAVLVASYLPEVKFDYLVASKGNASLEGATRNAIILKKYLGMKTKIVQGRMPKADANVNDEEKNTFHGNDGLGNVSQDMIADLKLSKKALHKHITYDKFNKKILRAKKITYVAVGPTTNLANALDNPKYAQKIDKIYIMGGGINEFNCSNNTEFNFSKDPKSVKKILESGKDVTLFTLDLTNHQRVGNEQIEKLESQGTYKYYIPMLKYNKKSNLEYNQIPAAVIHDAMPIFYMAAPDKFIIQDMKLVVDKYGATKVDEKGQLVHVAMGVKEDILNNTLNQMFSEKK